MMGIIRKLLGLGPRPWNSYLAQCLACAGSLVEKREYASAIIMLKDCIRKSPDHPNTYFVLGLALQNSGEPAKACDSYRDYLERDPGDALGAGIRLFLLENAEHPETLPPDYVTHLFDDFAPSFDEILAKIKYQAPEMLAAELISVHPGRFARLLDLGCGTGLSALPYRDRADVIEGVDISENMMERAREKDIYTHLHQSDLHDFLKDHENAYDAIISTDVMIYIGALEKTMTLASAALTRDGLFGFTVQLAGEGDFRLGQDHRYWHSSAYLDRCMAAANLKTVATKDVILRYERGKPVPGLVMISRRADA